MKGEQGNEKHHRKGKSGLDFMQEAARNVIALGGTSTHEGMERIKQMDSDFIQNNISPGGCADLLAITYMLHSVMETENLIGD